MGFVIAFLVIAVIIAMAAGLIRLAGLAFGPVIAIAGLLAIIFLILWVNDVGNWRTRTTASIWPTTDQTSWPQPPAPASPSASPTTGQQFQMGSEQNPMRMMIVNPPERPVETKSRTEITNTREKPVHVESRTKITNTKEDPVHTKVHTSPKDPIYVRKVIPSVTEEGKPAAKKPEPKAPKPEPAKPTEKKKTARVDAKTEPTAGEYAEGEAIARCKGKGPCTATATVTTGQPAPAITITPSQVTTPSGPQHYPRGSLPPAPAPGVTSQLMGEPPYKGY